MQNDTILLVELNDPIEAKINEPKKEFVRRSIALTAGEWMKEFHKHHMPGRLALVS